jgi:iron/manganese superoxide dismutase-like protein
VIDAWEHAWYLQYLNEKAKFFDAIWNVLNWADVAQRFEGAQGFSLVLDQVAERASPGEVQSPGKRPQQQHPAGRA